jgi:hypothetical protein
MKNPQTPIVFDAVRKYLYDGTSIEDTIRNCKDTFMFTTARKVNGGAVWAEFRDDLKPDGWEDSIARNKRITKVMLDGQKKLNGQYALEHGEYVGSIVRWYYSVNGGAMYYRNNGNTVPMSQGSKPIMDLPDTLPDDLDYQWYIDYANKQLEVLGL